MGLFLLFMILIIGGVCFVVVKGYNQMRLHAENVKESWSNISVVTRKKISLINQLVTVVSNYQESEKLVMLQVSADTVEAVQQAAVRSGTVLAEIGRMAQKFPELKANQQYNRLMDNMQSAETEVQNSRLVYNQRAKTYNTIRTSLPAVFYAGALGFGSAEYLSLDAEELPDAGIQRPMISDDSDRVNRLLGQAGSKAMTAARQLGQQGKVLAEKGALRLQQTSSSDQFHYVDSTGKPVGPVARETLDDLFQQGVVKEATNVMAISTGTWTTYGTLSSTGMKFKAPGQPSPQDSADSGLAL